MVQVGCVTDLHCLFSPGEARGRGLAVPSSPEGRGLIGRGVALGSKAPPFSGSSTAKTSGNCS